MRFTVQNTTPVESRTKTKLIENIREACSENENNKLMSRFAEEKTVIISKKESQNSKVVNKKKIVGQLVVKL